MSVEQKKDIVRVVKCQVTGSKMRLGWEECSNSKEK